MPRTHPRTLAARLLAGLGAVGLALLALVATATPAAAHASLVSVDPPDSARLDEGPSEVRLTFSEPVSAALGGVRVVDAEGVRVDEGAVRAQGTVVAVDLAPDLGDGTYVVTYRIVSADGHPVRGATVFGIGSGEVDASAAARFDDTDDERPWEVLGAVGRGLAYAGTLLAAGGALFLLLVHPGGDERPALVRVVRVAAVVGAVAGLVALPVQAALGTGRGAGALFEDGVLRAVLDDGVGLGLGLALTGLAVLVATLDRNRPLALGAAAVAAASFAATGHTRAGDVRALATAADVVHLLVVAAWAGGLVLLLAALRLRRRGGAPPDAAGNGPMLVRFSSVATVGLLGAAVTGSILGWSEVRTLDALTGTGYGQLLLAKLGAVAVLAALGAYNHLRLVPAARQGKVRAAVVRLHRTLIGEVIALVVVLGLTAVLVVVTPARTEAGGGPIERIIELGEAGSVQLVVAPARAGFNQLHLYTYDADGRPAQLAETIDLELELPSAGLGPLQRTATRAGPAHAQLNGEDLAVAGTWEITVRLRLDRFTEASGTAEVPIAG
jgi:copper transport protein